MENLATNSSQNTKLFISYARKDHRKATRLIKRLEMHGFVCLSDFDLEATDPFPTQLEERIRTCNALIVVYTINAQSSDFVRREVVFALQSKKRVISLLYEEVDLPLHLADLQAIDARKKRDPISGIIATLNEAPLPKETLKELLYRVARLSAVPGFVILTFGLILSYSLITQSNSKQIRSLENAFLSGRPNLALSALHDLIDDHSYSSEESSVLISRLNRIDRLELLAIGPFGIDEKTRFQIVPEIVERIHLDFLDDKTFIGIMLEQLSSNPNPEARRIESNLLKTLRESHALPNFDEIALITLPPSKEANDDRQALWAMQKPVLHNIYGLFDPQNLVEGYNGTVKSISWYQAYAFARWMSGKLPDFNDWMKLVSTNSSAQAGMGRGSWGVGKLWEWCSNTTSRIENNDGRLNIEAPICKWPNPNLILSQPKDNFSAFSPSSDLTFRVVWTEDPRTLK